MAKVRTMKVSSTTIKKIALVDDHPVVRHGLRALIEREEDLNVVVEVDGVNAALQAFATEDLDLAIVDISLADGSGIDLIRRMQLKQSEILILVASMYDEQSYAERVIRLGARGYVCKRDAGDTIVLAIRRVLDGNIYVSEGAGQTILGRLARDGRAQEYDTDIDRLTTRELEVFQFIADGVALRDIAQQLHLSPKTVESYRERIKLKLNIDKAAQLARFAHDWAHSQGA